MFGQTISEEEQLKIEVVKRLVSASTDAILSLSPQEISKLPSNIIKNLPQDFSTVAVNLVGIEINKISNENLRLITQSAFRTALNASSVTDFAIMLPGAILASFATHFAIKLMGELLFPKKDINIFLEVSLADLYKQPIVKVPSIKSLGVPKDYRSYVKIHIKINIGYIPPDTTIMIEERVPTLPGKETFIYILEPEGTYKFTLFIDDLPSWDQYFNAIYRAMGIVPESTPATPAVVTWSGEKVTDLPTITTRTKLSGLGSKPIEVTSIFGDILSGKAIKKIREEMRGGTKREIYYKDRRCIFIPGKKAIEDLTAWKEDDMYLVNVEFFYSGKWTNQMINTITGKTTDSKGVVKADPISEIANLQTSVMVKNDLKKQEEKEEIKSVLTTAVPIVAGLFVLYHSLSS